MTKITIAPNASGSGTFTLAAPNSNTDRTFTLPDATGEVLTSAGGTVNGPLSLNGSARVPNTDLFFDRTGYDSWKQTNFLGNMYMNNGVDRFIIDSAGRVTMPYQPFATASSSTTVSAGSKIPLNAYNAYRGGLSIDNTNNRFVVPVSGAYMVGWSHLGDAGSVNNQVQIRINGANLGGSSSQDAQGGNDGFSTQRIASLAANDYIEFWVISGQTHSNADYNNMFAFLLG